MHKKLLKVLHPNRYFIWALAYLIIFVFALLAYIYISAIDQDNQSVFSELKSRRVYTDSQLGFSVKYPSSWNLERDQRANIAFENSDNKQESITVTATTLEMASVIRSAVNIRQETDYQRSGYTVAIIKAGNAKGQDLLDLALISTAKKLFYISGHSSQFTQFVNNFKPQ